MLLVFAPPVLATPLSDPPVPPPAPQAGRLDASEARTVVEGVFGSSVTSSRETERAFLFTLSGFSDDRTCPLEGIRDQECGEDEYRPVSAVVYRHSPIAPVSGHLARNRIVIIDLFSDGVAWSASGMHGVLVFPGPRIEARARPCLASYRTRAGTSVALDLDDVDADGVMDLIYTWDAVYPGGAHVVSRDVWTAVDLKPERLISSGDPVPGVLLGSFDGVPLHVEDDRTIARGRFTLHDMEPGRPRVIVFERAMFDPGRTAWELRVIADFGDGWKEVISGRGPRDSDREDQGGEDDQTGMDCTPSEVPVTLSLEARGKLLSIEAVCRDMLAPGSDRDGVPGALRRLWIGVGLESMGYDLLGAALEEDAARRLARAMPRSLPFSAMLSLRAAMTAQRALEETFDGRLVPAPMALRDSLASFPVLGPLVEIMGEMTRLTRTGFWCILPFVHCSPRGE